jgi:beta-glucanase (GH16 family)
MYKLSILFVVILSVKSLYGQVCEGQQVVVTQDGQCDNAPFVLEFEDNFNGNSLDLTKWQIRPWSQGALSLDGEQEYNSMDNVSLSNGICKITAKKETVNRRAVSWRPDTDTLNDGLPNLRTYYYTSSNIWTNNKFGYGKYEIRCKIPTGKGFWPAFWMYGERNGINNEVDVFEFWDNNTSKHHMSVHYNGLMCEIDYNGPDYSQAFHTYTVIWDEYKIEWYVDGDLKRRSTKFYTINGQIVDCNGIQAFGQYILDKVIPINPDPTNIIMNMAIQRGQFAPDVNTPFPSSFEIDYIRYYKQMPCAGEVIISNVNQLNLSNSIYNMIIGTTIIVGENVTIQNGEQLELVARDEINLLPGFTAETGSNFIARINPDVCSGVLRIRNTSLDSTSMEDKVTLFNSVENDKTIIIEDKDLKIIAYPNPNDGTLFVDLGKNPPENYEIYLLDGQGKIVYKSKKIELSNLEIDMNSFSKGNYILNIFDTKNKKVFVNKIILN